MVVTKRVHDAQAYIDWVKPLLTREAENNLALGILNTCLKKEKNPDHLFIASERDGEVVLVMIRTTNNLILVGDVMYADHAVEFLFAAGIELTGLIGPYNLCLSFARRWEERAGTRWKIGMKQRIYRLDTLKEVPLTAGSLRKAHNGDENLLVSWLQEFFLKAGEKINQERAEKICSAYVNAGSLYVWEDGNIVSMVRKTRPSPNGIVITTVFTPREHRNKGYATTSVFVLSKILLNKYKFCTLYTDLANPTSNRIYAKIGFVPLADSVFIDFL